MGSKCACPAGFHRCGGRCLQQLKQKVTYPEAERLCGELGAHLATPRSEEENKCAHKAAGTALSWLGFTDVVTQGQFLGADGCGTVPSDGPVWEPGHPILTDDQLLYVVLVPEGALWNKGWAVNRVNNTWRPLCQLPLCYQAGCPDSP